MVVQGACFFINAVASFGWLVGFLKDSFVVVVYDIFDIWHTAVTDFHVVVVEYLSKFMIFGEVFF